MRIAHVSDCYLPRTGGIETQVRGLALSQAARGDQPWVITATPAAGPDPTDGIDVERLAVAMPGDLPVHPRTRAGVRTLLENHPSDVAHVHMGAVSPFAWGALRALAELRMPTVVTVHSMWGPVSRGGYRLARHLLTRPGVVVSAVSERAAEPVSSALGVPVAVLPNAIDPRPWRQQHPVPRVPGRLRVVTVSRLAPRKRIGALLRVIARAQVLLGPEMRISLAVIGDGPQRGAAERAARRLGIDARFLGRLAPETIRVYFAAADAYAQASILESFGIAALEARTFGLPVVARSQSGTSDFIHDGVEGLLADDDHGLAAALAELGRDPALGESIAAHNVEVPPGQTWDHACARASELYTAAGA